MGLTLFLIEFLMIFLRLSFDEKSSFGKIRFHFEFDFLLIFCVENNVDQGNYFTLMVAFISSVDS